MVNPGALCCSITLQAFTVLYVLAAVVANVQGGDGCPRFSCGHLKNISDPFRRQGDPPGCGSEYYELECSDSQAKIHIGDAAYYVVGVNFIDSLFLAMDTKLDTSSSCPLPCYSYPWGVVDSHGLYNFEVEGPWACFANCSRAITNNSRYKPVPCLSANNSFVYVWAGRYYCEVAYLEHSCGYLSMTPFDGSSIPDLQLRNLSYANIIDFIRKGFPVRFPLLGYTPGRLSTDIKGCLNNSTSDQNMHEQFNQRSLHYGMLPRSPYGFISSPISSFLMIILKPCLNPCMYNGGPCSYFEEQISDASILKWANAFVRSWIHFLECTNNNGDHDDYSPTKIFLGMEVILSAIDITKLLFVLCRFVLAPLAVLIFLVHKYWKTRITIDVVETFLRMQQMLGPTRYAYTDITAFTRHFRDKLGQGGYGSVFKGVLLPGNVHVAVKMLEGNSNCNGEDFISEVSTIGRIHHINVVRLVGFCSEEMRRALVYEYMPQGSLDKYIFSAKESFSWDKLNEIALGIARGINYLHQGCEMQILHFDIKPHNVLLDSNFVPKVADFGLVKLYPRGNNFVPLSALRGTVGYIAPEMISRSFGVISSKSDVYSFGMLLLEMAGGRRNADPNASNSSQAYYPSWVYDRLAEPEVDGISTAADMHELERKLCFVGLWCIQMRSHDRPTMSEAIEMLEGGVDDLHMPSRPFFCDEGHIHVEDSYHLSSELTAISEEDE